MRNKARFVVLGSMVTLASLGLQAQDAKSPANAAILVELMDQAKLESFTVKQSGETDRYVSVLYIPKSQLLVVSARYPSPPAMDATIARKDYRGAYADLNSSTMREGKLFVMDLEADGLHPTRQRDQPFDIIYDDGVTQTTFDGDWRKQKLSEDEYRARFTSADDRYTQMLASLIDGLKRAGAR